MTDTQSPPQGQPRLRKLLRLPDGTLIDLTRTGPEAPSKRQVKVSSGRQARKSHNGYKALQRVGGYSNDVTAIGQDVLTPLCKVRIEVRPRNFIEAQQQGLYYSTRQYTTNVGGSCSTGYIGGRG